MIEIITKPWGDIFRNLIIKSKSNIFISSPFIKNSAVNILLKHKKSQVELEIMTSFKFAYFRNKASDIESIERLVKVGEIKAVGNLHSKAYIFDKEKAIITSANLTYGGLYRNYEHGLLISNEETVNEIHKDLFQMFQNDEISYSIDFNKIQEIRRILSLLPPLISTPDDSETWNKQEILYRDDIDKISQILSPWEKDIYEILSSIEKKTIILNELYGYEKLLQKKHPNNRHIKEKIRQQMQYLRDKGLVEFIDRGVYKKLW